MKRAGIGIPYSTQTAPTNFEMSENFCEVLTNSLLKKEALDLRTHVTQVREGSESGQERRVDIEEGGLRDLK